MFSYKIISEMTFIKNYQNGKNLLLYNMFKIYLWNSLDII